MRFLVLEWQAELDRAREAVARFVGADAERLVFVPGATTGVAIALAAARRLTGLGAGDEIVTTTHAYAACKNQLARLAEATGAQIVAVPVTLPFDADALVEGIARAVTPRTRIALLDHVTSTSALVMPLERIVPVLAARGVAVIIDGAHAPGQIAVNVTALGALGVTWYTGNHHKWLCAPKASGFLAVAPGPVATEPLVATPAYMGPLVAAPAAPTASVTPGAATASVTAGTAMAPAPTVPTVPVAPGAAPAEPGVAAARPSWTTAAAAATVVASTLPLVTSHGATPSYGPPNRLHAELDWSGTYDPSAQLAVPAAIAAVGALGGGWPAVRARNHALALAMRDVLGGTPLAPDDAIGSMVAMRLELPAGMAPLELEKRLLAEGWEVPIIGAAAGPLLRVSAHLYNDLAQAEALAAKLAQHGARVR